MDAWLPALVAAAADLELLAAGAPVMLIENKVKDSPGPLAVNVPPELQVTAAPLTVTTILLRVKAI